MKKLLLYFVVGLLIAMLTGCAQPNEPEETGDTEYLEEVFFCPTEAYVENFEVTDDYIYVAEDAAGFSIWDNGNGAQLCHYERPESGSPAITNIKQIKVLEESNLLIVYNRYGTLQGMLFFDVTDKTSPQYLLPHTGNTGDVKHLEVWSINEDRFRFSWMNNGENYTYYSGEYVRLTPEFWQQDIVTFQDHDFPYTIISYDEDQDNGRLYLARQEVGLEIVDRESFEEISRISTLGQTLSVTVVDSVAFLANREEGIQLFDISDENAPEEIYSYNTTGLASEFAVDSEKNIFAVASTSGGVYLFAGPDGETKRLQRIYESKIGYTYKVELHGDYLYAGTRYGIYKFRIKNL